MTSPADEPTATLPEALRLGFARLKDHAPVQDDQIVPVPTNEAFPVAAADMRTDQLRKADEQKKEAKEIQDKIGQPMDGGIFFRQVSILGQDFNVIAAPQNLTDDSGKVVEFKYNGAKARVAELLDWNGRNGTDYATSEDLVQAVKDGSYVLDGAGWFIAPREWLMDAVGDKKLSAIFNGSIQVSSTLRNDGFVSTTDFRNGATAWEIPNMARGLVRPMRLVLA
jgi:hypothetical protein